MKARDGVMVPLSILYAKNLKRDGKAPLLLDAYGAYGIDQDAGFIARALPWLDLGGVFAVAHVRGGGELGEAWHLAGKGLTKPNTWRDAIDCVEYLIADGWTGKGKIAVEGGSAGGIMVGRFLTERPDLVTVAISQVGVSNATRAEFSENGPDNVPEFGTVKDAGRLQGPLAMDAYQHVKDGTPYPAVLLTTGANDPRVAPWEAGKMTARLQAATSSKKPVHPARGVRRRPRRRLDPQTARRRDRRHLRLHPLADRRSRGSSRRGEAFSRLSSPGRGEVARRAGGALRPRLFPARHASRWRRTEDWPRKTRKTRTKSPSSSVVPDKPRSVRRSGSARLCGMTLRCGQTHPFPCFPCFPWLTFLTPAPRNVSRETLKVTHPPLTSDNIGPRPGFAGREQRLAVGDVAAGRLHPVQHRTQVGERDRRVRRPLASPSSPAPGQQPRDHRHVLRQERAAQRAAASRPGSPRNRLRIARATRAETRLRVRTAPRIARREPAQRRAQLAHRAGSARGGRR